jgi:hypothetical protein
LQRKEEQKQVSHKPSIVAHGSHPPKAAGGHGHGHGEFEFGEVFVH